MANEINRIPTVVNNYAVYLGNSRLMGVGEVTLPSMSPVTAEQDIPGGGKVELPVLGQYESMKLGLSFRTVERACAHLMRPIAMDIVCRSSQQVYDGAGGMISTEAVVIYARVMGGGPELGTLKVGEGMDGKIELEVLRIRAVKGGEELYEIDKMNGICRILGVDYSAQIRADLGLGGTVIA